MARFRFINSQNTQTLRELVKSTLVLLPQISKAPGEIYRRADLAERTVVILDFGFCSYSLGLCGDNLGVFVNNG